MSSLMTPRINNQMTPFERYLAAAYALVIAIAVTVLALDLFYWRPDAPKQQTCGNQPLKVASQKK